MRRAPGCCIYELLLSGFLQRVGRRSVLICQERDLVVMSKGCRRRTSPWDSKLCLCSASGYFYSCRNLQFSPASSPHFWHDWHQRPLFPEYNIIQCLCTGRVYCCGHYVHNVVCCGSWNYFNENKQFLLCIQCYLDSLPLFVKWVSFYIFKNCHHIST